MTGLVVAIFALTYVLIAARRLRLMPIGRPAGALLGATLMVAVGALTPDEAYNAVDHDTILLLFGMMIITASLAATGFIEAATGGVLRAARTPVRLLVSVSLLAGVLSAFMVNDTVCLFLTPVVVAACRRASLPMGPYLIALATSANLGSAATLVGNPQNMLVGSMSGLSFSTFLGWAGPAAAVALVVNAVLLVVAYRRRVGRAFSPDLAALRSPPTPYDRRLMALVLVVIAGVITAFFAGAHLGTATLAGAAFLIVSRRRDGAETLARVDWSLLVFFVGLFVVVAALRQTGLVADAWQAAAPALGYETPGGLAGFVGFATVGSNLVSNVPMVLLTGPYLPLLGDPELGWVLLAYVTTVAGNLTLIGSVANIIVAEVAAPDYELGFFEYLRFGLVSTLITLAIGVPVILATVG